MEDPKRDNNFYLSPKQHRTEVAGTVNIREIELSWLQILLKYDISLKRDL